MQFRARLLIPRLIRKKVVRARQTRRRNERFQAGLAKLLELKSQYDDWNYTWRRDQDESARQKAIKLLEKMRNIIKRLARNNHRRELQQFLGEQHIPGWRKVLAAVPPRRR